MSASTETYRCCLYFNRLNGFRFAFSFSFSSYSCCLLQTYNMKWYSKNPSYFSIAYFTSKGCVLSVAVSRVAGKFATEDKISHGTLAYARRYKLLKTTSQKTGVNDVLICKLKVEAKTKHNLLKPLTMLTAIKYTIFSHD